MKDGERRRLVFTNLANGLSVEAVMVALHMSEAEVLADFEFVSKKIRSYRFERIMPLIPLGTIAAARANRVEALYTMSRLNLGVEPVYSKIETLPFMDGSGSISEAEQKMLEMRMRMASR